MAKKILVSEKFTVQLENFDSDLWHFHILVPDLVLQPFLDANQKRVICKIDGLEAFHCALMPKGDGQYFININKERRKKLGLVLGAQIQAQIKTDDSKYGLPICEELEELLKMDDEGSDLFHALSLGKQRTLIHLASSPKRSETRLKKAVIIIEYLKSSEGHLDFKALHEAFKTNNQF
jgi:hypothetical protein